MAGVRVALKVDVDTFVGTRDGVPRLLEILGRFGIKATFYLSLGPDNSGKAIRRIFTRKGFLRKMLRTRAPSTYGLKTLLYGTVLPAPEIAATLAPVMKTVVREGHEAGFHSWDHVDWHDHLPRMSEEEVREVLARGRDAFRGVFGRDPETTAAPGWMVSQGSLRVQDELGLSYSSDSRGEFPFYPVVDGERFRTLQVPTTLPTLDELLGLEGITGGNVNEYYVSRMRPGLNVHTIHAEMEGMTLAETFAGLLERLTSMGVRFTTLAEAAAEARENHPPVGRLAMEEIPGRAGLVAVQKP